MINEKSHMSGVHTQKSVTPVIKFTDMSEEMKKEVIETAQDALDKCNSQREVATKIRERFESQYKSIWHCIVGRNFSGYVTYETKYYIYFYIGQTAIMLFKSG